MPVVESSEVSVLLGELTTMVGREDPYSRYERLRAISPIVRADDGALVVTRHADGVTVTRDARFGHLPADMLAFLGLPDWAEAASERRAKKSAPSLVSSHWPEGWRRKW